MDSLMLKRLWDSIESEPELPDDMPDEMFESIKELVNRGDKEGIELLFRETVKATKDGIKKRMLQVSYGGADVLLS